MSSSPYAFGIDLGTTNSAIAYTHDDMVKMVPMSAQETSIPSLFSLDEQGNPIIGEQAKNQKDPAALISASKRLIGRNFHRAEELQQLFTYDIIDGGDKNAVIPILDQIFTMEEISAAIIQQLCQTAKDFLGEDVQRAVLTVPTYFDERQRSAIKKAGELAGLEVLRILNEPTAAALAYGSKKKLNKCVAVYDLGGGTFDLSIVNIRNNSFEVLASGGNPQLGGVDFDDRILRFFLEHIYEKYGYDLAFDKGALSQLRETAEQSKIILSKQRTVAIALSLLAEEDEEEFVFSYTLTREKLEELTFDLIETTIKTTRLILKKLSYTSKDLDEVLLVGGQALMPCIHKELEKMLGYPPSNNVHPKEVVAKGAALMAQAILDKDKSTMTLQDRLPLTIGVRKSNGTISPLFQQGTILPSKVTRLLPTVRDRQKSVVLQLYQGNDPLAQNNEPLQIFVFSNIRAAPKGVIKVETLFSLNENGLLRVQARDKATKSRVRVQALSPQQFSALKQERDASLKKLSATIVDTKEKQEESLNKKPDLLVDADLMISKPFPNPLNMRLEEIAPTHKPRLISLKTDEPPVEKNVTKISPNKISNNKSTSKTEKNKKLLQKKDRISVSTLFTRFIGWLSSLFGRS